MGTIDCPARPPPDPGDLLNTAQPPMHVTSEQVRSTTMMLPAMTRDVHVERRAFLAPSAIPTLVPAQETRPRPDDAMERGSRGAQVWRRREHHV